MHRIFNRIIRHPRLCAVLALLLALSLCTGLLRLEIDASTRSLFPADEPEVEYYKNVRANFGSDSLITVVVRSGDIFQPDVLEAMQTLASDFDAIDGVRNVLSLFSLKIPKRTGMQLRVEALVDEIPEEASELRELRTRALANPIAQGLILNETGTACAIHVLLRTETGTPGFEAQVVSEITERIDDHRRAADSGFECYALGAPIIKTVASRYIWHDLVVLGPIALLVIGGVIFFFFRSLVATLLPLITGSLSVLATLGFMGFAGFAVNPFTSVVVVLILVMGCTEDLHIVAEYARGLRKGLSQKSAIRGLDRSITYALFLTAITTFLGFLSIAHNPIIGLREFAIACAVGIFLNFVITLLLAPSLLQLLPPPRSFFGKEGRTLSACRQVLVGAISRHPLRIGSLCLLFLVAVGAGATRLEINTSYIRFFPKTSEVGSNYTKFSEDFGGASTFMVTVETGRERGVYQLETLHEIARIHDHLKAKFDHTSGYIDFLRNVYFQFSKDTPEPHALPPTQREVDMYSSAFGRRFRSTFIDYDGSRTAIRVRSLIPGSKGMRQTEKEILQFARENLSSDLEVRVTGERVLTARFSDQVTRQLIFNLTTLLVIVTVLLSFFFRSAKLGLLAIIPNMFPVLATFGYMGWAGIPLGTGTFAVAIVAFGIAVDDTIHFITRFSHEFKNGISVNQAIEASLAKELPPILSTSVALVLGYLVLVFSPFLVHRETGILFAIAIATAFFADLFVTPVLLRLFVKREKEQQAPGTGHPVSGNPGSQRHR